MIESVGKCMASLIHELLDILKEEQACYEEILACSKEKTEYIIEGDTNSLQVLTTTEQSLTGRAFQLGKKRETILEDMAIVLGQDPRTLQLTFLIQKMNNMPKEREQLQRLQKQLTTLMEELKQVNEQNGQLLEQSLEFIDFTVRALQSQHSGAGLSLYEKQGQTTDYEGHNFFDRKQ